MIHLSSSSLRLPRRWGRLASVAVLLSLALYPGFNHYDHINNTTPSLKPLSLMAFRSAITAKDELEPIHPLLLRPTVAISYYWDVKRLSYLEHSLVEIQRWRSPKVDVCIGTNQPERLRTFIDGITSLNSSGNIHACPLQLPLDKDYMLNWRTREVLGSKYADVAANYTSFVFLENDLPLSWDAMVAWAADTTLVESHGLKRSFYRVEVHPDTGEIMQQDYIDGNFSYVSVPHPDGGTRRFVTMTQGTYCGMFVATRGQLQRYMQSRWWPAETGVQCCALEFASWGFTLFEQPLNTTWTSSAVLPWDEKSQTLSLLAAIRHGPNKYVLHGEGRMFSTLSVKNVSARVAAHMAAHPHIELSDIHMVPSRHRRLTTLSPARPEPGGDHGHSPPRQ